MIETDAIELPKNRAEQDVNLALDNREVTPVVFNEHRLETSKQNQDFNYAEVAQEVSWWQKFKSWLHARWMQLMRWLLGDLEGGSFFVFLVQFIPYIILGLILGFIVWLFIQLNPGGKLLKGQKQGSVLLSEDEDILKHQHIPNLIEDALEQQNYRLAVRYYYLLVLKKLTDANLIDYQHDKTNSDYLSELNMPQIKESFKTITHIYDFIWYGNFAITERDYTNAANQFKKLEKHL